MPSDSYAADTRKDGAREPVRLGDRFEILPSQPIVGLDGISGQAFVVRPLRGRKVDCFAIVCSGKVPPRIEPPTTLMLLDNPGLIRLLDHGVVDWDDGGGRRQSMVFEKPLGRRLRSNLETVVEPMSEDQILRLVIQSLVPVLKELAGRGITHGGIRPTNLFLRDSGGVGAVTLGECATTPPGFGQPAMFETIERSMADHAARGGGSIADDLYAFGVTLMFLALGRNPMPELDDEALLAAKIERGSYVALMGNNRMHPNLTEPLRGLLVDDPRQRWGINQFDLWLSGRRLSPKQSPLPKRASRPLEFAGQEVWYTRALAGLLTRNSGPGTVLIEGGELDRWMRRSLGDDILADAVVAAVEGGATGGGKAASDRVLTRVAMTLDPPAPIRYRGKSVMPDGLAVAFADAHLRQEGIQPLAEMVVWQLPNFWASVQPEFRAELVPLVQTFDGLRGYLEKTGLGFGIERLLYEMNPFLHCLSPIVLNYRATSPAELLTALDAASERRDRQREPIDRHITAFLATRHRRMEEALFAQLVPGSDPVRRVAALLSIFAEVQARFTVESVPGLCSWLASLMDPAFTRFHNRPRREAIREQVGKVASTGRLADLLRCIDDPEAIRQDALGFGAARRAHKIADAEIEKLRAAIAEPESITETTGRQVTAILACLLGSMIAGLMCLMFLFK